MDDEELSRRLKTHATRHQASDRLRASVVTQIALQSAARGESQTAGTRMAGWLQLAGFGGSGWSGRFGVLGGFASGVLLTMAVLFAAPLLLRNPSMDPEQLMALHVHGLGPGPLFEVASSDRHTVKPWFQGKLDYAPQVLDLTTEGYVLVGGRTEALNRQTTATLVYGVRKHFITVFERPATSRLALTMAQQRGFNLAHWSDGVMDVWAISDVEAAELERFGQTWGKKLL